MTEHAPPAEATEVGVLSLRPIGVAHSPFQDRLSAPRQPRAAPGVEGTIELFATSGIEHALEDLSSFRFIWVIFWFHQNKGFKPKAPQPAPSRCARYPLAVSAEPHRT